MAEELTFRKALKGDLPRISEFRRAFFQYSSIRSCETEYYDWKCYDNPVQQGEMWIAEDGDILVGMKSMTPKMIKILGEVSDAAETGDTFTHPNYQRRGIFTTLFKNARERGLDKGIDFIYGAPNENSLPGYERKLDYEQIPIELYSLAKPVYPKRLLEKKLHFSPLVSILCPIVATASRIMLKIGVGGIAKSDILISQETTFPNDIDALWEQASRNYEVILVRSHDYLQWRYVANPDTYSILIARSKSGAILGYLVSKLTASGGIGTGYIVDFLTIEDNPNVFSRLLAVSLAGFFQKKVNLVYTWATRKSFYDKILSRVGFFRYSKVPLICYKNETGNKVLDKARKWHFTMGDSDSV